MSKKTIQIGKIAKLNLKTLNESDNFSVIQYLDTGNITKNKILNLQILNTKKDKIPSRAQRKVKKNSIIYSTVRPNQEHYGIFEYPNENLIVSTGFTTIDLLDRENDPKFIYYLLTQKKITDYLHNIGINATSSYPSIKPEDIGNLKFKVPENIEDQQKIASILSNLDTKIELNNKINIELETMAKTLYDYWFVQFDFPDENGKPYKTSGGKMVWNEELKKEIPEGWEIGTLLDIADYINGLPCQKYRPSTNDFLRVIKIKEMHDGFSNTSELVWLQIPKKAIIENGDVLFSWSASLEVQIWIWWKGALNQHIFKVTSEKYPKSFYFYQLLNYLEHFKMMAENRKTTMGHITQEHLRQSRIVLPKKELTIELEKIIAPIFEKKINNYAENQKLSELQDFLLPMLMNGQVAINEKW